VSNKKGGARDSGRKTENFTLSPVSRAAGLLCDLILGLAPQALCLRLLRRLTGFLCKAGAVEPWVRIYQLYSVVAPEDSWLRKNTEDLVLLLDVVTRYPE